MKVDNDRNDKADWSFLWLFTWTVWLGTLGSNNHTLPLLRDNCLAKNLGVGSRPVHFGVHPIVRRGRVTITNAKLSWLGSPMNILYMRDSNKNRKWKSAKMSGSPGIVGICGDWWSLNVFDHQTCWCAVKPWVTKERKLFKLSEFDRKYAVSLLLLAF